MTIQSGNKSRISNENKYLNTNFSSGYFGEVEKVITNYQLLITNKRSIDNNEQRNHMGRGIPEGRITNHESPTTNNKEYA